MDTFKHTKINDSTLVYIKRTDKNNPIVKAGIFKIPYWMYLLECEKYEGVEYIGINKLEGSDELDESINNKEKNKVMKIYYFEVIKKELDITDSKIKGFGKTSDNQRYKYVIEHGANQKKAYDSIINTFKIKDNGFGECQNILNLEGKSNIGYILSSGGHEITKENIKTLGIKYEDCLITDTAMYDFSELWPKNTDPVSSNNSEELIEKTLKSNIKPRINVFSNIAKKNPIKVIYQTIVDTITKYPSRLDLKTNVWKPVVKPEIKQLPKSEDRLVCIAKKNRTGRQLTFGNDFIRIKWKDANELISSQKDDDQKWEFISKGEYRRLERPTPGISFTAALGDYNENGIAMYKKHIKIPSNPSSSKKAKCLRKSNHCKQGVSGKKIINTYEISFFRNMKNGNAEFVYTITARNEEHAIARANKKAGLEGADLAYYKPKVELKVKGNINTKVKGESSYKRIILPLVTDLPERKDKKGNIIPWTIKELKFDPDTHKTELINTEIKTFTGYQITYQKVANPFKKDSKKWKHPIKDGRNKVKVIKSKNNKIITIKRK